MRHKTQPSRRAWLLPTLIVAGATALRILYHAVYARNLPFFDHPFGDAEIYLGWARAIAGGIVGPGPFYRAPLYPCFLALLLKPGNYLLTVYIAQTALGMTTLVLTYRSALRIFSRPAALVAMVLSALASPLLSFETKLLSATLVVFLVTLGTYFVILAADRRRRWFWLLAGLTFGCAAIGWAGALIIFATVCAWSLAGKESGRKAMPLGLAACLAVVSVVSIRNMVAGDDAVLISGNSGFTFYQGNNRLALGTLAQPPEVFELQKDGRYMTGIEEQEEFESRFAREKLNRALRPSQLSSFWTGRALSWIVHNPGAYLVLEWRKFVLALSDYESPLDYNIELERNRAWPLRLAFVGFGLLFALAVAGAFLDPPKAAWPFYAVALGTLAALLLVYVADRYRLPAFPALAALGGAAAWELWRRARFRKLTARPVIAGVLALLLSLVAFNLPLRRGSDILLANAYQNLGIVFRDHADAPDKAAAAFRQAVAIYERRADPANRQEQLALADARTALASVTQAPVQDSSARAALLELGSSYGRVGRHTDAMNVFARGVRQFPADPVLRYNLALAALNAGDSARALAQAETVLQQVPNHPWATELIRRAKGHD